MKERVKLIILLPKKGKMFRNTSNHLQAERCPVIDDRSMHVITIRSFIVNSLSKILLVTWKS